MEYSITLPSKPRVVKEDEVEGTYEIDGLYPGYGFASHKGYGAPVHGRALRDLGPCEIHRLGWSPVKRALMGLDPLDASTGCEAPSVEGVFTQTG